MHRGYIKLFRKLLDNPKWTAEPFSRAQAWIDLLFLANYKDSYFRVRGIKVEIPRGCLGHSLSTLADRWKWSKNKVIRYLNELEMDTQIEQQKDNLTTRIKIINYDLYQSGEYADEYTEGTQKGSQTERRKDAEGFANGLHLNKEKKVNKDKKEKKKEILIEVPDFIPSDLWEGFIEMRKDRKFPCTPKSLKLAIESLNTLKAKGNDPVECLKQTVERGYRGIFPVNNGNNGSFKQFPGASKNSAAALSMIEELRKEKESDNVQA